MVPEKLKDAFGLRRCAGLLPIELYRSRHLADATPELVELIAGLGVKTIFDLRKPVEREMNPHPECVREAFDIRVCQVDLQNDDGRSPESKAHNVVESYGKPGARMVKLYGIMALRRDDIAEIAHEILTAKEPVLVHCANGKDRAGVVCASVQWACGVSEDVIMADYLMTNAYNSAMNRRDLAHYAGFASPEEVEVLAAMFEAREEYLHAFFDTIAQAHGSVEAWASTWAHRGA